MDGVARVIDILRSKSQAESSSGLIRRSREFILPERARLFWVLLIALTVSALGALEPLALKHIFDELGEAQRIPVFAAGVAGLVFLEIARAILNGRLAILSWKLRIETDYHVRERVLGQITNLPISYHRTESVGSAVNKVNQSIQGYLNTLTEVSQNIVPAVVYLALSLMAMFQMEWRLSLVVLVLTPLPTLLGMWAAREQAHRERVLLNAWSRLYGRLNEVLSGILTVKGFAQEQRELGKFLEGTRDANSIVLAGMRRDTINAGARDFITTLARITAIGYGGYLVLTGQTSLGTLFAFLGYIQGLFGPVQGLTNVYQTVRKGVVGLETIYDILDHDDVVADRPDAVDPGKLSGRITFRNVQFAYQGDRQVLRRINLDVKQGETVALAGPSGSGKTTLISLLQRQYNVTGGAIFIDGKDIRDLKLQAMRRQIGVVFQDVHLFDDTVHANIAYGVPGATREQVEAAARAANADEFIRELPDGYDTPVGERGNRLSGGQKQRIAIARAFLLDPPILILDEATSALDAESEFLVQEALRALAAGRTTIIIAHRLSTVMDADRIVVLRNGRIDAIGRHEQLVTQGGYYATLVRHQLGGRFQEVPMDALAA